VTRVSDAAAHKRTMHLYVARAASVMTLVWALTGAWRGGNAVRRTCGQSSCASVSCERHGVNFGF